MIQPRIFFSFPAKYRKVFRSRNKVYLPKEGEYLLNHNRSGLLLALKAMRLHAGSCVGMMAYNCHTVMNAIEDVGCKVKFIDVTKGLQLDLTDLRKKKDCLSAIIVSHLFGIANDIDAIRMISPNVPVIEDCAHAFGMKQCGNKGDFAVYSIGPGKFPSVGDGGILKVNNPEYRSEIDKLYSELHDYSVKKERGLFVKLLLMHWLYKPCFYSIITLPLIKQGNKKIASAKELIMPEKMAKGIAAVYNSVLPNMSQLLERQQANSKYLMDYFNKEHSIRVVNNMPTESNCFMFPLYCDDPLLVKTNLFHKGIESETHFRHCLVWAKEYGYKDGECPNTEDLVHHLLMVPTYKTLKL